jgi:7-cyano-7-deazaguanine synthase
MRNTVFLTLAAALLESRVLRLIEDGKTGPNEVSASIFIAANAVDYSGYPDCRPEYFDAMRRALFEGSKLAKQYGVSMDIETPVLRMTKAEIVKLAVRLGAPLEHTWSCYEGEEIPCGACDSCLLRAKGFAEAGIKDPLLERLRREGKIA